jgi:uncharacterized OB-fold protein
MTDRTRIETAAESEPMREHCFIGERCTKCGKNVYDPGDEMCPSPEVITYTSETEGSAS